MQDPSEGSGTDEEIHREVLLYENTITGYISTDTGSFTSFVSL